MLKLKPGFQYIDRKEINLKGIENIILMGDIGCTGFDAESKGILRKILQKEADLFFILGDLVCSGTEKEFNEMIDFCKEIAKIPIFALCGNHDAPDYQKALGLPYYALILEKFVIVALDNSIAPFSKGNLAFLENELRKRKDKKFLIFFHIPPPTDLHPSCMKQNEWFILKEILDKYKGRIECICSSHIHGFQEYRLDGYRIFITGGGGAKIYELEKDTLRSHHAIKLNLNNKEAVIFEVMPIIL